MSIATIPLLASGNVQNESFNEELCKLAGYGQGHLEIGEII